MRRRGEGPWTALSRMNSSASGILCPGKYRIADRVQFRVTPVNRCLVVIGFGIETMN